jgi:hypothetical protein
MIDHTNTPDRRPETPEAPYEQPELVEYGSLQELTLSGSAPLSDSFGGAAGGGS